MSGYEIHHGVTTTFADEEFFGGARHQHVLGTMVHGSLESDEFRHKLLRDIAATVGRPFAASGVSFGAARQARLDLLADFSRTAKPSS